MTRSQWCEPRGGAPCTLLPGNPTPRGPSQGGGPEAVERFYADAKRPPPSVYESPSLLWKGQEWRQLIPDERAQVHMLPPATVAGATQESQPRARQVQTQNALIGNSLHVPSIMLALVLLLQLVQPSDGFSSMFLNMGIPFCPEEQPLRDAVRHTALQPGLAMSNAA